MAFRRRGWIRRSRDWSSPVHSPGRVYSVALYWYGLNLLWILILSAVIWQLLQQGWGNARSITRIVPFCGSWWWFYGIIFDGSIRGGWIIWGCRLRRCRRHWSNLGLFVAWRGRGLRGIISSICARVWRLGCACGSALRMIILQEKWGLYSAISLRLFSPLQLDNT